MSNLEKRVAVQEAPEKEAPLPGEALAFLSQSFAPQAVTTEGNSLNRINRRFFGMMASGRDFRDWKTQAKVRLRWMILPALVGMCVSVGLTRMALQGAFSHRTTDLTHPVANAVEATHTFAPPPPPMPKPFSSTVLKGEPVR